MTMAETSPPNPNSPPPPPPLAAQSPSQPQVIIITPPPPPLPQPPQNPKPKPSFNFPRPPPIRLTQEFDSEAPIIFNKISCKILDSLAKLKLSFNCAKDGQVSDPQIGFFTKYLSCQYDVNEQNALFKSNFHVGDKLHFKASQDIAAQEGELSMVATLPDPSYKLELSSAIPFNGLPRTTFRFPQGEVSLEQKEREDEELKRALSVSGILKGQFLNGFCTAQYKDENLNLRYSFKDNEVSFIPTISLPSNAVSFAFKRRIGPSDKMSYYYNFDSSFWNAVYKHTDEKHRKLKIGYDSMVRLGWASVWFGDENGKTKTDPLKMKVQLMLQVPQDDVKSPSLMFRVKKRWDF